MSWIVIALRIWLGSLFLYTGSLKLIDLRSIGRSVAQYELIPGSLTRAVSVVVPFAEIVAGVLIFAGWLWPMGPTVSLALGLAFSYAIFHALRHGLDVGCGCAGAKSGPVTFAKLSRSILISFSSLVLVFAKEAGAYFPAWSLALATAVSVAPALGEWRRRRREARYLKARELEIRAEIARQSQLLSSLSMQ